VSPESVGWHLWQLWTAWLANAGKRALAIADTRGFYCAFPQYPYRCSATSSARVTPPLVDPPDVSWLYRKPYLTRE